MMFESKAAWCFLACVSKNRIQKIISFAFVHICGFSQPLLFPSPQPFPDALTAAIAGFVAAVQRNKCAAIYLYISQIIDFAVTIAMVALTWFMGGSFSNLLSILPTVFLNGYMLLIVRSYYLSLIRPEANYADVTEVTQPVAPATGALDGDEIDDEELEVTVLEIAGGGNAKTENKVNLAAAKAAKD